MEGREAHATRSRSREVRGTRVAVEERVSSASQNVETGHHNRLTFYNAAFRKGDAIYDQLRRMGGSYDWDRACFTMDPVRIFSRYPN